MTERTAAVKIAEHVTETTYEQLPQWLRDEAKILVLDWLGVALGGSKTDTGRIAGDTWRAMDGSPESTVIGRDFRLPAPAAAFTNAISSHSIELDDADDLALFHFSPPTVSVALAVAETVNSSGRDLIAAACLGWEVMARLSLATNPSLRDRGFHTTPVCGVFGGAVAAGRLLGLDQEQMVSALGLAGAEASGLMEFYGTSMQKRYNPGGAAMGATMAALLAKNGFSGAKTILEGERGFLSAFSDESDPSQLTAGLGSEYPVAIEYKPYATARPIHNAIDCALAIRDKVIDRLDEIEALDIRRHPDWAHFHTVNVPRTYHEAQMNLPFPVAVALMEGKVFWDQFSEENLANPEMQRLARAVSIEPDTSLNRGVSCHLTVRMKDGTTYESTVDYPKGSPQNPMTRDERLTKFFSLAEGAIPREQAERVADAVESLETTDNVSEFVVWLAN